MSNTNLKPLTEKVLSSGIVDEHMAKLMEKWGYLPDGASQLAADKNIENATREQLEELAENIADEVAKQALLRETDLDLDKLRWPRRVYQVIDAERRIVAGNIDCVVDRLNRYYFRSQDVMATWFVPGFKLVFDGLGPWWPESAESKLQRLTEETILEVTGLCCGDQIVAIQVSTEKS